MTSKFCVYITPPSKIKIKNYDLANSACFKTKDKASMYMHPYCTTAQILRLKS